MSLTLIHFAAKTKTYSILSDSEEKQNAVKK